MLGALAGVERNPNAEPLSTCKELLCRSAGKTPRELLGNSLEHTAV